MRSKATLKNSIWGIVQQVIICILSLFSRRVMLETIGVEGVGLNALLTSIITMLSLAELGIGTAIIYHMYAPLAKGDKIQIARLMQFYRYVYRIIAAVIALLGLCLLPFMGRIVTDVDYSQSYISMIFILFLIQTASSYLFTYKRSMFSADQKQYIITLFDLGYKVFTILAGIAVLKLTHELAYYLLLLIVCTIAENILISHRADKEYPYIKENCGKLSREENKKIAKDVRSIFVGKISGVITNSTDSILINAFVGTVQTGLYSNYNIIIGTLSATLRQFTAAMRGSVGNLIATEPPKHIHRVFNRLLFIMFYIAAFCACCLTGLIDKFITISFGDGLLLDRVTVFVCIFNLYMSTIDIPVWCFVAASGLFRQDKYISIAGSVINLIISFILGKKIGMAGILIGTSATYVIQFILKVILFYRHFLKINCFSVFAKNIIYALIAGAECAAVIFVSAFADKAFCNPYVNFIICGILSAFIPIALNSFIFVSTDEFRYVYDFIRGFISKKEKNS